MVPDSKEIAVKSGQEREVESLMEQPVKLYDKETLHRVGQKYFLARWIGDEEQAGEELSLEAVRKWMKDSSVTAIDIEESRALGWAQN